MWPLIQQYWPYAAIFFGGYMIGCGESRVKGFDDGWNACVRSINRGQKPSFIPNRGQKPSFIPDRDDEDL